MQILTNIANWGELTHCRELELIGGVTTKPAICPPSRHPEIQLANAYLIAR